MVSDEDARQIALEFARRRYTPVIEDDEVVIDEQQTQTASIGWVFWAESRIYLETERFDASLIGVRGIFVDRSTGVARSIAGKAPTDLEVEGSPGPDWPTRAWLAMPLAFLAQVGVWVGCWIALEGIVDAIGLTRLPVNLIAALVMGIVATGPTAVAVRWTRFGNVDQRIPLAVILAGAVVGELVVSLYFIANEPPWLEFWPAVAVLPEFVAAQSLAYFSLKGVVLTVMLLVGSQIGADEKTSQRRWRDD